MRTADSRQSLGPCNKCTGKFDSPRECAFFQHHIHTQHHTWQFRLTCTYIYLKTFCLMCTYTPELMGWWNKSSNWWKNSRNFRRQLRKKKNCWEMEEKEEGKKEKSSAEMRKVRVCACLMVDPTVMQCTWSFGQWHNMGSTCQLGLETKEMTQYLAPMLFVLDVFWPLLI